MPKLSNPQALLELHSKPIEVDRAQESWTKRVSIKKVLRQQTQTKAQPEWQDWELLPLNYTTSCTFVQAEAAARESAYVWVKAKIEAEVMSAIKNAIVSKKQQGFTMVSASPIAKTSESASVQSWKDKAMQPSGAQAIYQDVTSLITKLGKSMGADYGFMLERKMTLLIPGELLPQMMAQTAPNFPCAQALLIQNFPQLKILSYVGMTTDAGPFAMLVCDDGAFGQNEIGIGLLEMQGPIKLYFRDLEEDPIKPIYKPIAPAHRVVITHPEQIAVLTGI